MKTCKACGILLAFSDFHVSKNHKDGFRAECKACVSLYWKTKNKNNGSYKVYLIRDKETSSILYVGATSQSLMKRLRDHVGDSKFERGKVFMELVQDDLKEAEALTLESLLIQQYDTAANVYDGYKIHGKRKCFGKASPTFLKAIRESNSRPIICVNTGKTYESLRQAAQDLGLTESKVSLVCQGKRPHTKGYKFSYL